MFRDFKPIYSFESELEITLRNYEKTNITRELKKASKSVIIGELE